MSDIIGAMRGRSEPRDHSSVVDDDPLAGARTSYGQRDWVSARDQYTAAHETADLGSDDLYALGNSYWWLGLLDQALPIFQAAHRSYLTAGQANSAALVALTTGSEPMI